MKIRVLVLLGCGLFGFLPAHAQDIAAICADRPGKGTSACTVPAGRAQLELGLFDESFLHRSGVTTASGSILAVLAKTGVSDFLDVEAGFSLYQFEREHGLGRTMMNGGAGDLFLRAKYNPLAGAGRLAFVFDPYIKIPTAGAAIGNRAMEGGLQLPLLYDLGGGWSFAATPEADLLRNQSGSGMHANLVNVAGLGLSLESGITLGAELWTNQNFDPSGTIRQYSADVDAAILLDKQTQLDGGLNFGLNRVTPDVEIYFGISKML